MASPLIPLNKPLKDRGPVLNIVLDGVGLTEDSEGNAFSRANTPILDGLKKEALYRDIFAHGTYVGLPDDGDMGNSEVGHNALGAGKIFPQGAKLVNESLQTGKLFEGSVWQDLIKNCKHYSTKLHFLGLVSDGNVHSHIDHLKKMISKAVEEGLSSIRVHALLDGRDVGPKTAEIYLKDLEDFFIVLNNKGSDVHIASVGGRMNITMDRYQADWSMVERGWALHVEGKGRQFTSALEGLDTLRKETNKVDQDLDPYIIAKDGNALGVMTDNDSVIFFNFRGDRAIEISQAFDDKNLDTFKREKTPAVKYAGMMQYDGDLSIPNNYLVDPPDISDTMGEYLVETNVKLFAVSETQKYGHVTFFWNGNNSKKFSEALETYVEIPSDKISFDEKPEMKAKEIAEKVCELLEDENFKFGRLNFANGDMVGHTGNFLAAKQAIEVVDTSLGSVLETLKKKKGIAIILADHGNCEEMYEMDKKTGNIKLDKQGNKTIKTSHTLNKVPMYIIDYGYHGEYELADIPEGGLANIPATTFHLMGYQPPIDYKTSLIQFKSK